MNVQNAANPKFADATSTTATSPLLGSDLEKNAEVTSVGRDSSAAGGALVLVACAAQGAKYFLKQPEFKPTTNYTDGGGIVQKCGIRPYSVPVSVYYMQGCSTDFNACNDVPLDEAWCQQPDCIGKPSALKPGCYFQPGSPLTGDALVSSCFKHQIACMSDNMQYDAARVDFLRDQANHDSLNASLNYLTGAALLGVVLAHVFGRGRRG